MMTMMIFVAITLNVLNALVLKCCIDCAMSRKIFKAVGFAVVFAVAFVANYNLLAMVL